jgi:hypothetical protein
LFDKYFGRPIIPIDKHEYSNIDCPSYTDSFEYSNKKTELSDFSEWLKLYLATEKFIKLSAKFIDINKRLKNESDDETRLYLIRQMRQLETEA